MVEKIYWAEVKVKLFAPRSKEKSTLVAIAHYADPSGNGSYASQELIAWHTGHSRRTVRRHIKALVGRGELVAWVDLARNPPTDRFHIPLVLRDLQDLMRERQLSGLPLFVGIPRAKLSLGEGQTDPTPGSNRPSINDLNNDSIKKEGSFRLKTKKEKSVNNAHLLQELSTPGEEIAPETQAMIVELLEGLKPVYGSAQPEIVEPTASEVPFTQQEWDDSMKVTQKILDDFRYGRNMWDPNQVS